MSNDHNSEQVPAPIAYLALRMRCPRCAKGSLYKDFLNIAEACPECDLSLRGYEQGDGPAIFSIFIIGSFVAVSAAITEIKFQPPYWLHAVLWIPMIIIGSLLTIRMTKAALIAMQYRYRKDDFE